jgi:hypothetical protein
MVEIIGRQKAHFRIQIYDLVHNKTKTISLIEKKITLEELKKMIIECLENPDKFKKK